MKYILGIDQGTTQTTAVVVDENASFVEKCSVALPARFPNPGWVEQDPFDIVRTVKEAVAPLIDQSVGELEKKGALASKFYEDYTK